MSWRYYLFRTNVVHKHPWVSKALCWMGRHDYEPLYVDDAGGVCLECFYCGHRKHSTPTGEFPKGQMNGRIEGGKVVMEFGKSITGLAMDPEEARALADGLMKHADKAEKRRG